MTGAPLRVFGVVLLLGGVAHSAGVLNLYRTAGLPDANRILVDVWVAQTQLLTGGLYLTAARALRRHEAWRGLAVFGALTMIGFCVVMLPVLFARAPIYFRIPPLIYLAGSVFVVYFAAAPLPRPR
jgi:hypothetical protein